MKKAAEKKTGTLKKLAPYVGRYWIFLAVSILLSAAAVILQLYVPILFGDAIDQVAAAHRVNFARMGGY